MKDYWLTTSRLGFGLWTEGDLEQARALWGDFAVTRLFGGPFSERQVADRLALEIRNLRQRNIQYWPLFLRASGDFVGACGLRPHGNHERVYETGFYLRPPYWRQGLGYEAERAVIGYAFSMLGAEALVAGHHPQNEASRRLLEKLGFRFTHTQLYPPTGLQHLNYRLTPGKAHLPSPA